MQTELTQRDKKLLVFLGVFVIVVCIGYWGIKPMIQNIIKYNEEIEIQQEEKDLGDLKVSQLPMMVAENSYYEEEILKSRSTFYPMMTSDEIDKLFTGMILDYNLYAYEMDINIPNEECELNPYKYVEEKDDEDEVYTVDDYYAQYVTSEDGDEVVFEEKTETGIYMSTVKMRVGGNASALQKFIDDLSNSDKKQLVSDYKWDVKTNKNVTYNDGEYDVSVTYDDCIYLTIYLFMCKE